MKQPFIREMVRDSVAGLVNHPSGSGAVALIKSLFAAGQQGFWLPFTDFASLTQDSAGTLPYTALEQPVGLIYDKSRGGALSAELVLNGDFDTDTSWSIGAKMAISDGKWRATDAPAANPSSLQNTGASVSGMVKVTLVVSEYVSGVVFLRMYAPSAVAADTPLISANGTYSFLLQTNGWDGRIGLRGNGGTTLAVDSLSIKQVLGNHASQVTSTARGVVSARVNLLGKSEDFADANWIKGGGAFTGTKFTEDATAGAAHFVQQYNAAFAANSTISFKARLSNAGRGWCLLWDAANNRRAWFNLSTGVAGGTLGAATSTITAVGSGVYDCEMVFTNPTAATNLRIALAPSDGAAFYDGDGVSAINIFRTSVTLTSQSTLPYQRVNTPTDYDAVGFPKSLSVQVDDFYTCGGGGSTTGFFYSDFIRPMGGAGTRRVIWSDRSGNNGYELAINTSDKLELSAGNGSAITTVASTVSAAVAEGKQYEVMDNGTVLSVQIDGSAAVTVARPVVTAGSSTITLYRGASTGYFNGKITEPIYRAGPPPSAYERSVIRGYQMQKAGL